MEQEFIYQQTIVQWRIPIQPDGKLGKPQLVGAFSPLYNGSQGFKAPKKKTPPPKPVFEEAEAEQGDDVYL